MHRLASTLLAPIVLLLAVSSATAGVFTVGPDDDLERAIRLAQPGTTLIVTNGGRRGERLIAPMDIEARAGVTIIAQRRVVIDGDLDPDAEAGIVLRGTGRVRVIGFDFRNLDVGVVVRPNLISESTNYPSGLPTDARRAAEAARARTEKLQSDLEFYGFGRFCETSDPDGLDAPHSIDPESGLESVRIERCRFSDVGTGVLVQGFPHVTVRGCEFTRVEGFGVEFAPSFDERTSYPDPEFTQGDGSLIVTAYTPGNVTATAFTNPFTGQPLLPGDELGVECSTFRVFSRLSDFGTVSRCTMTDVGGGVRVVGAGSVGILRTTIRIGGIGPTLRVGGGEGIGSGIAILPGVATPDSDAPGSTQPSSGTRVVRTTISGATGDSVFIRECSGTLIQDSRIVDGGENGIGCYDAAATRVIGTQIVDCDGHGVLSALSDDAVDAARDQIYARGVGLARTREDLDREAAEAGDGEVGDLYPNYLPGLVDVRIHPGTTPPAFVGSAYVIQRNLILRCSGSGVVIEGGISHIVLQNLIRGCGGDGISVERPSTLDDFTPDDDPVLRQVNAPPYGSLEANAYCGGGGPSEDGYDCLDHVVQIRGALADPDGDTSFLDLPLGAFREGTIFARNRTLLNGGAGIRTSTHRSTITRNISRSNGDGPLVDDGEDNDLVGKNQFGN